MAHLLQQKNYNREPTSEQRKVFTEAFGMLPTQIPSTRIAAHLMIRELLGYGDTNSGEFDPLVCMTRRNKLKEWQTARKQKRAAKKAALVAAGIVPNINGR